MDFTKKPIVYVNKSCKTFAQARVCPRGEALEIEGRHLVAAIRLGAVVSTKNYTEIRLVNMQPDKNGCYWTFSCPVAYGTMLPLDIDGDIHGRWVVNDAGYLLYQGQVENGSLSDFASAIITDNPDWFKKAYSPLFSALKKFARKKEY